MTIKEKILQAVLQLPEDATIDDAMERLFALAKIECGLGRRNNDESLSQKAFEEGMAQRV